MPFIDVKLTKKINEAQETAIKSALGEYIEVFPGKSENWLMCCVDSDKKMYFRGDNSEDSAFIEVKLFGAVSGDSADRFTGLITEFLKNTLNIAPSRIYIRFEGGTEWGWNGSNF